jgi:hypothetical protein
VGGGVVGGGVVGGGVVGGGVVGGGVVGGGVVGGGVVGVTVPLLQATPFSVKLVGTALVPIWVAWKPKDTEPPLAPMVPFQWLAGLLAVTVLPLCVTVAFQEPVTRCPLAKVHTRFQPLMAELLLLVTFISAVKPLLHWFIVYATWHTPPGGGMVGGGVVGGGVVGGGVVGGGVVGVTFPFT